MNMIKTVMIVDDAPFVREILRMLVQQAGFEWVGEAADGEEAIEQALFLRPHLILMDIVLPKKSGLDATREILKKLPGTTVIGCSSEHEEQMVVKVLEAGCVDFIKKPFQATEVMRKLENLIKQKPQTTSA